MEGLANWVEPLEERQMMSATLVRGTLNIMGTKRADTILVRQSGTTLIVIENGRSRSFRAAGIRHININAREGRDRVNASGTRIACTIDGSYDADTIVGSSGSDFINGGDGNDYLSGGPGNDTIRGSDGDDVIHGGNGNDSLIGGKDEDVLFGEAGNDFIDSNDEDVDIVVGGPGEDEAEVNQTPSTADSEGLRDAVVGVEDEHD